MVDDKIPTGGTTIGYDDLLQISVPKEIEHKGFPQIIYSAIPPQNGANPNLLREKQFLNSSMLSPIHNVNSRFPA